MIFIINFLIKINIVIIMNDTIKISITIIVIICLVFSTLYLFCVTLYIFFTNEEVIDVLTKKLK